MPAALRRSRPPLPRFAVAWFPEFRDIGRIEDFRRRHDPMAPHIPAMVAHIAADLGVPEQVINVKAKTTEGLGFTGRREGIAAEVVVLIAPLPPGVSPGDD